MKQRGISYKSINVLVSIKVNNNHLLDCFEAPHVSSNMLGICKPNCLICSFVHGFGLSSSTCPNIAHQIWWIPCRIIYIVRTQVFDESWKHRAWIEIISYHLFGPKGPTIDLTSSTLQLCVFACWTWGKSKAKNNFFSLELHLVVFVFGPKPCFPFWLLRFHQRCICEILNVPRGRWWYDLSNPTTWMTSCQPC
jgi:hypothetical protein